MMSEKIVREKPIPEEKKEAVKEMVEKVSTSRTVLIASCKGLPGQQFHDIKKKLRDKAEIKVARKNIINRAIDKIEKGAIKNLKDQVKSDIVVIFSGLDPFELSGLLAKNQSERKAKAGDIAPEDLKIDAGPTDLPPGPAISELGSVGLKVAVKDGKLEIMKGAVIARKGEQIKENVASVLGKLNVTPIKVGFAPLVAYDSKEDKFYVDIAIDVEGTLETLREFIGKSLGFAFGIGYPTKETIRHLIAKASTEEKALAGLIKEEKVEEETKSEEKDSGNESAGETDSQKSEEKKKESEEENAQKDTKEEV
jgi:large subunit ribosomal protein L10